MLGVQRTTIHEFHHDGYRLRINRGGGAYAVEIVDTLGRHRQPSVDYVDATVGAALAGLQDRLERPRGLRITWREDAIRVLIAHRTDERRRRGW